ncbi:MAG: hypothetical protein ACK4X1_09330 [Terricaulis sp.]
MQVVGDYYGKGYAHLRGLFAPEVMSAFLHRLKADLDQARVNWQTLARPGAILKREAIEIYGYQYKPMLTFLWGLTPTMCALTGRDLLPTYNYFRIYREGDICRVHSDRESCEHSLSLTLGYSDAQPWAFEIGDAPIQKALPIRETFEDDAHSSIVMQPGDAILYQGVRYRHGRITPNPNKWSAHLFLHWVDREGPHKGHAFDQRSAAPPDTQLNFA